MIHIDREVHQHHHFLRSQGLRSIVLLELKLFRLWNTTEIPQRVKILVTSSWSLFITSGNVHIVKHFRIRRYGKAVSCIYSSHQLGSTYLLAEFVLQPEPDWCLMHTRKRNGLIDVIIGWHTKESWFQPSSRPLCRLLLHLWLPSRTSPGHDPLRTRPTVMKFEWIKRGSSIWIKHWRNNICPTSIHRSWMS